MKKCIGILAILFYGSFSLFAQNDAITKYFDKYVEDEQFTVVYISPKMFQMIAKLDMDEVDQDTKDVIKGLKGLRILTTEHNGRKYYDEAIAKFNTSEYELLMTVRDKSEDVRFFVKDSGDIVNELLLLVGGDEFVMLSFVGEIDLNKISKLANSIDVKGVKHLEKVGDH